MSEQITIFEIMRSVLLFVSPIVFIVGVLLLIAEYRYRKLEEVLGREIGGIRKIIIPKLETTIYTFQEALLRKRVIVGLICIICSALFFFIFKS